MLNLSGLNGLPVRCLPVLPGRDCIRFPEMPSTPGDCGAPPIPIDQVTQLFPRVPTKLPQPDLPEAPRTLPQPAGAPKEPIHVAPVPVTLTEL